MLRVFITWEIDEEWKCEEGVSVNGSKKKDCDEICESG